jgi:hypothetical protein
MLQSFETVQIYSKLMIVRAKRRKEIRGKREQD